MKKRVIATFAVSDGRSAKNIRTYSKTFDSYESMCEYEESEPFTVVLYWWYIPECRRD